MPRKIREVAERFVDLVLETGASAQISNDAAIPILFDLVSAAGFECYCVMAGHMRRPLYDAQGRPAGKTHNLNEHCPYKAVNSNGGEHEEATMWFDKLFDSVELGNGQKLTRDQLVNMVVMAIEENIPLEPILLNVQGETLVECVRNSKPKHSRDSDALPQMPFGQMHVIVGIHKICANPILRLTVSATHDVLYCPRCGLRIHIKKTTDTYGKLRAELAGSQEKQ